MSTGMEWGFYGAAVTVLGAVSGSSWFAASQFSSLKQSNDELNTKLTELDSKLSKNSESLESIKKLLRDQNLALVDRVSYVEGLSQSSFMASNEVNPYSNNPVLSRHYGADSRKSE